MTTEEKKEEVEVQGGGHGKDRNHDEGGNGVTSDVDAGGHGKDRNTDEG